ncbi:hypothetical protein [Amycolatopsis aidingensis]|uniref:hypothetical protein n=1 Tax=Amycolatopsis aidingensis TaxID=2842453 RepID=UPI001C0C8B1D|nr:hypothetical protein [Amycolatopsis aidingensis]
MAEGFRVDDLNRLAKPLAEGAQNLADLATDAPTIPNAGDSTGIVASALVVLSGVVGKVTMAAANSADDAQAAQNSYDAADQAAGDELAVPCREIG